MDKVCHEGAPQAITWAHCPGEVMYDDICDLT